LIENRGQGWKEQSPHHHGVGSVSFRAGWSSERGGYFDTAANRLISADSDFTRA
jgi:hypothetical protein